MSAARMLKPGEKAEPGQGFSAEEIRLIETRSIARIKALLKGERPPRRFPAAGIKTGERG